MDVLYAEGEMLYAAGIDFRLSNSKFVFHPSFKVSSSLITINEDKTVQMGYVTVISRDQAELDNIIEEMTYQASAHQKTDGEVWKQYCEMLLERYFKVKREERTPNPHLLNGIKGYVTLLFFNSSDSVIEAKLGNKGPEYESIGLLTKPILGPNGNKYNIFCAKSNSPEGIDAITRQLVGMYSSLQITTNPGFNEQETIDAILLRMNIPKLPGVN